MKNAKDPAKMAVIERFRAIATDYQAIAQAIQAHQTEIDGLKQRLAELGPLANDCYAAARLFNFDLITEATALSNTIQNSPPLPEATFAALPKGKTIRELILEEAEKSYPEPVKATPLRLKLEQLRGEKLHEKTIGMTLYRLSVEGIMQRNKREWYFVPADLRPDKEPKKKPS